MTPDITSSSTSEVQEVIDTKKSSSKQKTTTKAKKMTDTSPEAALEKGLKLLIQEGVNLESQLMEDPELYDNDPFDDMVEEWEKKIKLFRNTNSSSLTKPQELLLKILKKKAEYLND